MQNCLFIFPGQGAQYAGMGSDLFKEYSLVRQTYEEASDVLGYDIANISFDDNEEKLLLTRYTQPALLTHSVSCLRVLIRRAGGLCQAVSAAGHSLGEYSALVASDCLTFSTALDLVRYRAELMAAFGNGEMEALPISREKAELLATKHYCGIAACNMPEQTVVGGLPDDLENLLYDLRELSPKKSSIRLKTEGAFHTYFMVEAAIRFRPFLEAAQFNQPSINVLSNFSGTFHEPQGNAIRTKLFLQLFHPVLWYDNMSQALLSKVSNVIEFGGGVGKGTHPNDKKPNLASITKRILRSNNNPSRYHAVINLKTLEETMETLEQTEKNLH